jgi:hypothetical protein
MLKKTFETTLGETLKFWHTMSILTHALTISNYQSPNQIGGL